MVARHHLEKIQLAQILAAPTLRGLSNDGRAFPDGVTLTLPGQRQTQFCGTRPFASMNPTKILPNADKNPKTPFTFPPFPKGSPYPSASLNDTSFSTSCRLAR